MTELSGCQKTQNIRELLANWCSDEDCLRLSAHLDTCKECRAEIDLNVAQMNRMLETLRTESIDDTSLEPALGAAVEQLLAYDPAAATQTEQTELLRTLPSSTLPPYIGPYKVVESIDRGGIGFVRKMTTRSIVAACAAILVCAFAGAELWGVTQVTASVIHIARGDGTLIIDINDPEIQVSIDGATIEMTGSDVKELRLRPGKHHLQATRRGVPFKNEDVIVTRRGKRLLRVVWKPSEQIQVKSPPLTDQRKAIAYVLGLGGQVQILVNWAIVPVSSVGELPPSPFEIESLNLSDNSLVADSDLLHFTALHSLHKLYLTRTQITDVGLEHIAKFSELKVLSVSTTQVTDKGIGRLTALQKLDKLDLERTGITNGGLKKICGLPKLSRLNLNYTRVTDQGMTEIPRLKNLEVLYVAGTPVTDKSIDNLKKLTSLRELMLSGTGFTESGIARLKNLLLHCTFAVNEESHLW